MPVKRSKEEAAAYQREYRARKKFAHWENATEHPNPESIGVAQPTGELLLPTDMISVPRGKWELANELIKEQEAEIHRLKQLLAQRDQVYTMSKQPTIVRPEANESFVRPMGDAFKNLPTWSERKLGGPQPKGKK